MIEVHKVNKSFDDLHVLKDVNLSIQKGEIVSIVGPSGAGKTTLLQIMGTLDKPNSGRVIFEGKDVTKFNDRKLSDFRNRNIGFVFQFHQLLPEFTALENTMIPALIANKSKQQAEKEALQMLELMGMIDRKEHKPAELSGGESQRIAVARALINNPMVVFADEPSGSLDTENKNELHSLFFKLRDELNQSFVIVTHDTHLASLTDRIIRMKDGIIE